MQFLNLEEDSPNHFYSNMFVCEKVAFPFAVVRMFGVVLWQVISTTSDFLEVEMVSETAGKTKQCLKSLWHL